MSDQLYQFWGSTTTRLYLAVIILNGMAYLIIFLLSARMKIDERETVIRDFSYNFINKDLNVNMTNETAAKLFSS